MKLRRLERMEERIEALEQNHTNRLEKFVSIEEGAEFIGITPSMLSAYCCRGELPSYKIGNVRKVRLSELGQAMNRFSTDPMGALQFGI